MTKEAELVQEMLAAWSFNRDKEHGFHEGPVTWGNLDEGNRDVYLSEAHSDMRYGDTTDWPFEIEEAYNLLDEMDY
jgi:hypothetical protein